ncbi:EamA family transporter [Pseudovibrio exalbescens]|uniref:DMT family transporter n=1 Tax=Pseudovibrio exalbescens TaxID=197461 RepID=UPI002365ACAF|nr:EamA family transporter [Pseudovibrio exalbescens]MDD7910965.1 EamA family transporter [Pseudovibrio exalbescens]
MNALLFAVTVLIWGSTWIAISLQVGPVPVLVSVFYRFALAGLVFLIGLVLMGRLKLPQRSEQPWILMQALCLFSFNFIMFYMAAEHVPSGVISVVFSFATVFNALNARLFFGDRITGKTVFAGSLGVLGLTLLFAQELTISASTDTLIGIACALAGTLLFSLGNMVSRRNSSTGLTPVQANAWGMPYGAAVLLALIWISGTEIVTPPTITYLGALIYLAVFGSVVGFTTYLMMVARLGSAKAAYATVLFPIIALALSTVFEGYTWSWINGLGLCLALLGNVVMFSPQGLFSRRRLAPAE